MTKVLLITSGGGGVGKTTTAVNLATALKEFGRDVILVDLNLESADISLRLGAFKLPVALQDVIKEDKSVSEALYMHPSGLRIIPTKISSKHKISIKDVDKVISWLVGKTELVILDSPTVFNSDLIEFLDNIDEVVLITTAEEHAVIKTLKAINKLEEKNVKVIGVVVNKFGNNPHEMKLKDITNFLEKPILGVIRNDDVLKEALKIKHPIVYSHPESSLSQDFKKLAASILGEKYEEKLEEEEKQSLFHYVLKMLGLRK